MAINVARVTHTHTHTSNLVNKKINKIKDSKTQ